MSGFLTNLFAMSAGSDKEPELKQRQVMLTGSKLVFSMPENFSKDFAADDLIETVDLSDASLFKQSGKYMLMRRWWDFTESSFLFNKEMGTIMLAIYVNKSPDLYANRISLIDVIFKGLDTQYKESNKVTRPDFQFAYPETYESFNESLINQQRWISYNVATMNATEATISYISPLTNQFYIEFSFTLMLSTSISSREFEDKYSRAFIQRIMQSVRLEYDDRAAMKTLGVDMDAIELNDLVIQHTDKARLE